MLSLLFIGEESIEAEANANSINIETITVANILTGELKRCLFLFLNFKIVLLQNDFDF